MNVDVTTEIQIDRPVAAVAGFASSPDNVPAWYANIKSVEWNRADGVAVGSQIAFVADFLGRRLEYVYEIVELIPERKLVMQTADGPFPMETTYQWRADGRGTRMTLRNRGQPSGFSSLVSPLMVLAIRRANRKDLRLLKQLLESQS